MKSRKFATNIINHLGGSRFIFMTGAEISYGSNYKKNLFLQCSLPNNLMTKNHSNGFIVDYNRHKKTYTLSFIKTSNSSKQIIDQISSVYPEEILPFFIQETGFICHLH